MAGLPVTFVCFITYVLFTETRSESVEIVICEGDEGEIRCSENDTIIYIEDASYGRRNMSICEDPESELRQVHCTAATSLSVVWEKCNGKTSCILLARNEEYGIDPCPRLRKYLSVIHRCDIKGAEVIGHCPFEFWYPWMNADVPTGTGDYETFYRHRSSLPDWCKKPDAVQIQLSDGRPVSTLNDVIKSGADYGVSCSNTHQSGRKCGDYRARFCCSSDCAQKIINKTEGVIVSPNFPKNYDPLTDCSWIIETDYDKYLSFTVTFLDLERRRDCIFDHLKIVDLTTQKEVFRECQLNSNSSRIAEVSGSRVQVRFISDGDNEGRGFRLEWKARKVPVCKTPSAPLFGGFLPNSLRLWRVGTALSYFCKEGYSLNGEDNAQCQASMKWSNPRPICKADCATSPEEYLQRLPDFCSEPDGAPKYVNVGKCSKKKCQGKRKSFYPEENCCRTAKVEVENVNCGSFYLPVKKVIQCECGQCLQEEAVLSGIAIGVDEGDPLVNGTVQISGEIISHTDENGKFVVTLKTLRRDVTLTFSDIVMKKFLNKIQVIEIPAEGHKFLRVRMYKRPPVVRISSKSNNTVVLKSAGVGEAAPPVMGRLNIPANSVKDEEGNPYTGEVELYAHSVNNENPESWQESPGPFVAKPSEENDELVMLQNYGIFQFQANGANNEPLELDNVEVQVNASHVNEEHLPNMHIYSFNNTGGHWEVEGHLEVIYDQNDLGERETFLIGTINITVDKIWSLNVLVEEYCYAKVRTYESVDFDQRDQLDDVSVRAVYMGTDGHWQGYSSEITTYGSGACVMVPCNAESGLSVIHFTALTSDSKELIAAPSQPFKEDIAGFTKFLYDLMKYRRFDHDDNLLSKTSFNITFSAGFEAMERWYGPIYAASQSDRCFLAPPSDYHFRFYLERKRGRSAVGSQDVREYSEVSEGGDTADPRYWGPLNEYSRACFIKVSVLNRDVLVRATSSGGVHPLVKSRLYGYRQECTAGSVNSSSVCLEFKCAKYFEDGIVERPLIVTNALSGDCHLAKVNPLLEHYLSNVEPTTSSKRDNKSFTMYSPASPLGSDFGIYTARLQTYDEAKFDAQDQCSEGSSLVPYGGITNHEEGVAITFEC